jgi:transcriptional regulator with XRE-family HTH domain
MVLPLTMQAFPVTFFRGDYVPNMRTGRPSKRPRAPFGQRVYDAREAIGLSQAEVAAKLGINQASYGAWERDSVALRPEQVEQLAKILNVSIEHLYGVSPPKSRGGPAGKLRRIFEQANNLPREQQRHILKILEPFVAQHANGNGG